MRAHLALALAVLATATASFAADPETGKVVSHDAMNATFTIETDLGNRIDFHTAATTRMTRDDVAVGLGDLVAGTRVRVTADDAVGSAPRHATRVELLAAGAAPVADSTTSAIDTTDDMRMAQTDTQTDRLPSTATPLPLIALLGSGSVLAGLLLRRVRR